MAFLEVTNPPELRGKRFTIERDEVIIGRSRDCDFQIPDTSVSSRHAAIRRTEKKYTLADLGSTNGTAVNDMPIQELRLNPRDVITLGSVELLFDGDDIEPESRPSPPTRTTADTVRVAPPGRFEATPVPDFAAKKSHKTVWIVVAAVVGVAVLFLAWRFLNALLSR
ncbi:MAG: FHA domain-containing protein [Kiritimatiellia bacterium]